VDTSHDLRSALNERRFDIVISDHNMPGFSGDDALAMVRRFSPDLPFIVVSGTRGEEHAVEVMRAGANDFIVKTRLHRLAPVVERELEASELRARERETLAALEESRRQLAESQRLEGIGRLAGGVAHDFNNLIGAILSYADLVQQALPEEDKRRADVEEIKRASRRAAELTRQLLTFSRQQMEKRSSLQLNQVINNSVGLVQGVVGNGVDIDLDLRPELWNIRAERLQIEQVLMNLAANARDAMPEGGRLTFSTDNVVVAPSERTTRPPEPGEYVQLRAADSGVGIPQELQAKIFEPFFTTKEVGKGVGLGLATIYGIVRQSGGYIYVDSSVGRGTTFTIFFPRS
jgi:signal transduction histidine kinase